MRGCLVLGISKPYYNTSIFFLGMHILTRQVYSCVVKMQRRAAATHSGGYRKRSLSETAMFRIKTIFGNRQFSRLLGSQRRENALKVKILNRMMSLGMPISVAVDSLQILAASG